MTREQWLMKAVKHFTGTFECQGYKVPPVRVSVGLPWGGRGSALKRIGEHWCPEASTDKVGSIFISPVLADGVLVLSTLIHEMVHAAVGNEAGHGPIFKKCALAVGLEGKMRATTATSELESTLKAYLAKKPYPHAALNVGSGPKKKQSTRMVKCECLDCGYIARTSRTNIDDKGAPLCPCNGEAMMEAV